jgi:hypothetical protein
MKTKRFWFLFLYFYFTTPCYSQDAIPIQKDTPAPFTGVLLPPDKAQDMKNTIFEKNALKKMNDSLNITINLQDDLINRKNNQITTVLNQNDKLAKTAYEERSMSNTEKAIWFFAGTLTTVLVLYGVKAATK